MSARGRIGGADDLVEAALGIEVPDGQFEPGVARIETLLQALVEATVAVAEALVEANEHRRATMRIEHPGVVRDPVEPISETRPYAGG